jgi:hypothetical protein
MPRTIRRALSPELQRSRPDLKVGLEWMAALLESAAAAERVGTGELNRRNLRR